MIEERKKKIDDDALSRQLATFGHEAQHKLMAMKVFIYGINGLGIQVAKNLILAGPSEVAIYDQGLVEVKDLSRNFYARENHIGKMARANASLEELQQLNPNVDVFVAESQEIQYITEKFTFVVVIDNYDKDYLIKLNDACREKGIGFIAAGNLGLYGYTFVDFGKEHSVFDSTGQAEVINHIAGITQAEEGEVFLFDEKNHELSDGDVVTFKEVKGMTEVNGKLFKVKVKNRKCYSIGDTRDFTPYENGGVATQVKMPETLKFKSFEKSLKNPFAPNSTQLPICTWQKFGYPEQLHVILNGVYDFWAKNKRLPALHNEEDASQLKKMVEEWQKNKMDEEGEEFKVDNIDEKLIYSVAKYSQTQISPLCSFWGGIIAQQIVKHTGKYTPIRQWLHHEYFEVLPENKIECSYLHTRYFDYNALFGDLFTERASKVNSFLIGAGALGCQFIKMFALMGLSTHENKKIVCTDDDSIEISNLNRQFLFRKHHVGKNKSETACNVGKTINQNFNIQSVKLKVAPNTEDYFNDEFWEGLDFVVNAVDNIAARKYLDLQCIWYQKPLFESGTLGTKCHSQIIIPHKTLTYNDIRDPPEKGFALCTVKNAPYMIEHTIQWARQFFEEAVGQPTHDLKKFFENRHDTLTHIIQQNSKNPSIAKNKLQKIKDFYMANKQKSYKKCVEMAVNLFYECFYYKITDLLEAFPADAIDKQTGKLFWYPPKRPPKAIPLDLNDPLHLELIQATANIYATAFKINMEQDGQIVKKIASEIKPERKGKKSKISFNEDKEKEQQTTEFCNDDREDVKNLYEKLMSEDLESNMSSQQIEFEKDDPTNWHIEFMAGLSNLRARNYDIEEADKFKIKITAGKIIPAIATTTAMVVGAVGVEIIKLLLQKEISAFKNVTINLALPLWVFNDPQQPITITHKEYDELMAGPVHACPQKFTVWDKINIKGPKTIKQVKQQLQKEHNIEISMITFGTATVFSSFGAASKKRLEMNIDEAVEDVTKVTLEKTKKSIKVSASGDTHDGISCILPDIRYFRA